MSDLIPVYTAKIGFKGTCFFLLFFFLLPKTGSEDRNLTTSVVDEHEQFVRSCQLLLLTH